MKEATGDLNMTVVVVIVVAMLVASFSMVIWPMIKRGLKNEVNCSDAVCSKGECSNGVCECKYYLRDSNGNIVTSEQPKTVYCPYKG